MEFGTEVPPSAGSGSGQKLSRKLVALLKRAAPFAAGVLAALLGLLLFNAMLARRPQVTLQEVNQAVAQALASATPAPAYSTQVYQIIRPALVLIQVKGEDAHHDPENALGSGVLISDQGTILTALHVVEGANEIQLTFADGTVSGAQVAAAQPQNDIAVLQAEKLPEVVAPAVLGNPNALQVGDEAYAVGNPFGLYSSMSAGVISGFERSFKTEEGDREIDGLIQIDAAVNPGNSGGPLLNRAGQVVGIVVGILNPADEEFFVGIGFAVPITAAGGAAGLPQY